MPRVLSQYHTTHGKTSGGAEAGSRGPTRSVPGRWWALALAVAWCAPRGPYRRPLGPGKPCYSQPFFCCVSAGSQPTSQMCPALNSGRANSSTDISLLSASILNTRAKSATMNSFLKAHLPVLVMSTVTPRARVAWGQSWINCAGTLHLQRVGTGTCTGTDTDTDRTAAAGAGRLPDPSWRLRYMCAFPGFPGDADGFLVRASVPMFNLASSACLR